jgi:hypothetical protein
MGLFLSVVSSAIAADSPGQGRDVSDGVVDSAIEADIARAQAEPEPGPGHLPGPSKKNMKLVSRLRLTNTDGVISDVGYHKGFAYLGEWLNGCAEGDGETYDAEVHVVNVKNPSNPREVATIPNSGNDWSGEGIHVITVRNDVFTGDVLLMSSEACDSTTDENHGGITLVDVTDPRNPEVLVRNFGDTDDNDPETPEPSLPGPNDVHSVMGWRDGQNAYAVLTDNEELLDVDILDISDPANPQLIAETGLPDWPGANPQVLNEEIFLHDFQVKRIGGEWKILLSYWDLGWVILDVSDPANPTFEADTDYPTPDPLTGFEVPEGNAHQAWLSKDNRFFIGTDEDFSPFRLIATILSGPNSGTETRTSTGSATPPVGPDAPLGGPTYFVGGACAETGGETVPPAPETFALALIERGVCTFTEKVSSVTAAGWDGALIFNNAGEDRCNSTGGMAVEGTIPTVGILPREFGYQLLGVEGYDEAACRTGSADPALPAPGTQGADVNVDGEFDAWGYVHLIDAASLEEIDAYAVRQSLNEAFAVGFGDLSVHEVQTDARRGVNLGYLAYYNAGARVVRFGIRGLKEVGHYIHRNGNNLWGIEPVKNGKKRPWLLFSDRDFGLYVLKYTGPQ